MSWHYLQEREAASWEGSSLDGAPSALLSLMPTHATCCLPASATGCSTRSQFGTTFAPSTEGPGLGGCGLSAGAFPARTSAAQARGQDSTASAPAYGWKWPGSLARFDPSSRSWKTRQCSLLGDSTEFSGTWPRWGSMRDGEFLELMTLAPHIAESASGSWPTPRRTDADRGGRGDLLQAVRGNENSHFKLWQTPVADDAVDRKRGKVNSRGELKLSAQVKAWPTPHGFSKDGKSNGPSGNELGRAVNQSLTRDGLFTTPTADDTGHRKTRYAQGGTALSAQVGGSLSPTWVEWLMGWCLGWTDCAPLAMDKFRSWQQQHGGY